MKLVRCQIKVYTPEEYLALLSALTRVMIVHTANYESATKMVVTVTCAHVLAERNLENILGELNLTCIKSQIVIPERYPVTMKEVQGPTWEISPPLTGVAT